jgi:hypothetical protein
MSPLRNFIFFEFSDSTDRDTTLNEFESILKLIPSVNSVVVKMNHEANDESIINPFGFAWIMFTGDAGNMNSDISKLEGRRSIQIGEEEEEKRDEDLIEYSIRDEILYEHICFENSSTREYAYLALHSLNNILSTWNYSEPKGLGAMFDGDLFGDPEELLSLSRGFAGDHPYNFIEKATPERPKRFLMVRKKLNGFLAHNEKWRKSVNCILDEIDHSDIVDILIYNPLNLFGMINDVHKTGRSSRIPYLRIIVRKTNGVEIQFYGALFWRERLSIIPPREAVKRAYRELNKFMLRSVCHSLNDNDVFLSELYGLTYEVACSKGILKIENGACSYEDVDKLQDLQDFLNSNDELIDQVGRLYSDFTIGDR